MAENSYKLVVARMPDEDLITALKANEAMYLDEMILAVLDECEKRKLYFPGADALRSSIAARIVVEEAIVVNDPPEEAKVVLPTLYSQTVILAFTIFFSPLFGGIMLAMNVWRVNKKAVWQVILFSLVFTTFAGYITYYILPPGSFAAILIRIGGALILSELLWNHLIGKGYKYDKRKIIIPLIIALLITIPIIYYLYQHPELIQLPTK